MKNCIAIIFHLLIACSLQAQQKSIVGIAIDSFTRQPIFGASVVLQPSGKTEITDDYGAFKFQTVADTIYAMVISAVGYEVKLCEKVNCYELQTILLCRRNVDLSNVVISTTAKSPYKTLAETDIALRGAANSQELLRIVPGLFIGQHQGGGKAEQIFLRGFDSDHGTDISIQADGIPVNMVSHAHAQGYADSHFIIPETIERIDFSKGPYDASKGDGATTGNLQFITLNHLSKNIIKLEAGQFQTYRALAIVNLLRDRPEKRKTSWYAAWEYSYSNSYFDNPQHFKRFNFFTKLNYKLSSSQTLTVAASTFWSRWAASGQIPERAVDSGWVAYYGALDSAEGGLTSRTNVNLQLNTFLSHGNRIKNQLYYSRYKIDLHSNFTFFLLDPVNGDEIRQRESRHTAGYNGSWISDRYIGAIKSTTEVGVNIRFDATRGTELAHTIKRYTLLNDEKLGDITELGTGVYITETVRLNGKLRLEGGLRFDHFYYRYHNRFTGDTSFNGTGKYSANNQVCSPKLSVTYQATSKAQIYLSLGKGFHTNDARVVVKDVSQQTLPSAYGTDLGVLYKPLPNLLLQVAAWHLYLQQEFIYAGDGGTVEFNGKTRRYGFDVSVRYQPASALFFDVDVNYAHGRSVTEAKGENYIPLAPVWSSSGGISYRNDAVWSLSLRYRYLSKRPANADYSLTCQGYFVNDLVVKRKSARLEYGLIINNLFNIQWKETQFETLTRLQNEQAGVNGISFTPGTKLAAKLSIAYFIGSQPMQKKEIN